MNAIELRAELSGLGYPITADGVERAFNDGVLTETEAKCIDESMAGWREVKPAQFSRTKFDRAVERFTIAQLGETEKDAHVRFWKARRLNPAVVLRGPDGRWYAFGNRGSRRNKATKAPVVKAAVPLRGGCGNGPIRIRIAS